MASAHDVKGEKIMLIAYPNFRRRIKAPANLAGKKVICSSCKLTFTRDVNVCCAMRVHGKGLVVLRPRQIDTKAFAGRRFEDNLKRFSLSWNPNQIITLTTQ